jgi:hypothetical protein
MSGWVTSVPIRLAVTRASWVLRVPDQSAATVTKTISDLASLTELASLAGSVAVLQRGLLRIRHP